MFIFQHNFSGKQHQVYIYSKPCSVVSVFDSQLVEIVANLSEVYGKVRNVTRIEIKSSFLFQNQRGRERGLKL